MGQPKGKSKPMKRKEVMINNTIKNETNKEKVADLDVLYRSDYSNLIGVIIV